MCGIAGFISSRFGQDSLTRMGDALKHRGPDAKGYFFDKASHIGLAHRRLSVIDVSQEANQPMESHCGRYVMVYNGEVYNYKALAKTLSCNWKTTSDSEVILQAFVQHGAEFVHLLNGMFAISIWDRQEQKLMLFRDRFGIKPVLYYWDGKDFAFASELKSLLTLGFPKRINKQAVKDYFFLEYTPQELTVFEDYYKLKPGSYLVVENGELSLKQYYNILDKYNPIEVDEHQATTQFTDLLASSVELRKISDVPLGAFLSGGTDSSLICAMFQHNSEQALDTFNIGFDVAAYDESEYATKVAEHLKTKHHFYHVDDKVAKNYVERLVDFYDEPFAVPSTIPTTILSQVVRKNVTVALSGDGGDELFMGYGYYNWYERIKKVKKYGGKAGVKLAGKLLSASNNKGKRAARVFDIPDFDQSWLHIWSQEQYMFTEKEISQLFDEEYQHTTTLDNWKAISSMPIHPFEKISLFDIQNYLAQDLLHKVDIASMSSSLELRVPFLDHNVVEYAVNLPLHLKVKDGEQKYLLKKVLSNYLPNELVYREKWGFPAPIGDWLLKDLSYLMDKYLSKETIDKMGLFNYQFVEQLVGEFKNGADYHFKRVWALIYFSMWYNRWMEKN